MDELVSIIMPAYNAGLYISESINSVIAQSYKRWELIVVDDGSTDNTKALVETYCLKDVRIKYVYQQNGRQGKARNTGIAYSTGSYIAFLDSDDLWLPEKLSVQLLKLVKHDVDLVFSDSAFFTNNAETALFTSASLPRMNTEIGLFTGSKGLSLFLISNRIPILTVVATRESIVSAGGFTENPLVQNAEDYHLWIKMLLAGRTFLGTNDILALYRKHTSSISDSDGQNLRQVVEAKVDLKNTYPKEAAVISSSIKHTMLLSLEQVSRLPREKFFTTIDRYLLIQKQSVIRLLFKFLGKIKAKSFALKLIYFIYNYL